MNTPPAVSIINVCASGSTHSTGSVNLVIATSWITLSSVNSVDTNLGTLVDIITFSFTSSKPWAWYNASEKVVSLSLSFTLESVNLNSLVPVLNLSVELCGILNEPSTLPVASVIKSVLFAWDVASLYPTTPVSFAKSLNPPVSEQ